jgi:hypothetical protein
MAMYNFTERQMRRAVEKSNGTMESLKKQLKMKSQHTAKAWLKKFPEVEQEFYRKREELLDVAESCLIDNLKSDNALVKARTAEFILKNLAGSRFLDVDKQEESIQSNLVKLIEQMVRNTD